VREIGHRQTGAAPKAEHLAGPDGPSGRADRRGARVTAVVASYNSSRHLPRLAELMRGASVLPLRMLLVDNASSDGSPDAARENGFEVLQNARNGGFGAACNAGLEVAESEYVLLCNPDVRPASDTLELLLGALERTPRAAVAGAALGDGSGVRRFSRIAASVAGFLPSYAHRGLGLGRRASAPASGTEQLAVDYVEGAFMLCRVAALRSVGGFDERFFLYHEEEDLCRRLARRGWLTLLVPGAVAGHDHGTSSDGVGEGAMTAFRLHSLYRYQRKYHSRPYAELSRLTVGACVLLDRLCRMLTRRRQVYPAGTARAAFRTVDALREAHGLGDREQRA
jgi:N-acetylglucosaminyl-diphospho-decaprenol L-rhamnosyltransferase